MLPDVSDNDMWQTIDVEGKDINVFYDTGCGDVLLQNHLFIVCYVPGGGGGE